MNAIINIYPLDLLNVDYVKILFYVPLLFRYKKV